MLRRLFLLASFACLSFLLASCGGDATPLCGEVCGGNGGNGGSGGIDDPGSGGDEGPGGSGGDDMATGGDGGSPDDGTGGDGGAGGSEDEGCGEGFYALEDGSCEPLTVCGPEEYEATAPTPTSDRECMAIQCEPGQRPVESASPGQPPCGACDPGEYCAGGATAPIRCGWRDKDGDPSTPCVGIQQVAAGAAHTCALDEEGELRCWGEDADGKLDVPDSLAEVTQLVAGANHNCVVHSEGKVLCWGKDEPSATALDGQGGVASIATHSDYGCAVLDDGDVVCKGTTESLPVEAEGLRSVLAAMVHVCALYEDGELSCWGFDGHDRTKVPEELDEVVDFAVGFHHTCAIHGSTRKVDCWGQNTAGQIAVPDGLEGVTHLAAGYGHNCAADADGELTCWGRRQSLAGAPAALEGLVQLVAGRNHTCAIYGEHRDLICWGEDSEGQSTLPAYEP